MMHGPEWRFLRIGRFLERTEGICRVLEIKRKTLSLTPGEEGRPIDFHQWQGVLRSLSAYEPYRRHHDARIVPSRVLDFVLRNPDFPRSLLHCVAELERLVARESVGSPPQVRLGQRIDALRTEIGEMDGRTVLRAGGIEGAVRRLRRRCTEVGDDLEDAFFRSQHRAAPAPAPPPPRLEAPQ
jgi:uncharacterized alpha-E superfamily protein